jgi:DNA-binding response OmpR family regulator
VYNSYLEQTTKTKGIWEQYMAKILIVDDDILITGLMQTLVAMSGHDAIIVNDSIEAMETAVSVKPDLITLDLMMPGLSGYDLCQLLRADQRFDQTPIVIISAKEDTQSREKALKMGATEYLTKPFDIDHFLKMIQKYTG